MNEDGHGKTITNQDIYQLLQAVNAKNINIEKRLERIESSFCKEIQQINNTVKILQEENKQLKKELQQTQKRQKKYNIVIYGVSETEQDLHQTILEIITNKLEISCIKNEIRDIYRLGKLTDGNKPRPTLIEFVSFSKKLQILKSATKLKGTGLYIRNDLTQVEIEENKTLVKHLQQAREKNYNARIYKNQLHVNGEIYNVEDLVDDEIQLANTSNSSVQEIPSTSKENASSAPATPNAGSIEETSGRKLRSNLHLTKNADKKRANTIEPKEEKESKKKKNN